ncbi:hypothetical protein MTR_0024s0300 [Medicago truncatula]|uniref:Uncharacterized protein n=1 Tax=Medicago truncatula TaxID=3880 RepID=A0A072TIE0_MEDTR|nr:hypothetical protein MTR_0024s0300 [Medicago truncatula]
MDFDVIKWINNVDNLRDKIIFLADKGHSAMKKPDTSGDVFGASLCYFFGNNHELSP